MHILIKSKSSKHEAHTNNISKFTSNLTIDTVVAITKTN
jgi:hypothetical protein